MSSARGAGHSHNSSPSEDGSSGFRAPESGTVFEAVTDSSAPKDKPGHYGNRTEHDQNEGMTMHRNTILDESNSPSVGQQPSSQDTPLDDHTESSKPYEARDYESDRELPSVSAPEPERRAVPRVGADGKTTYAYMTYYEWRKLLWSAKTAQAPPYPHPFRLAPSEPAKAETTSVVRTSSPTTSPGSGFEFTGLSIRPKRKASSSPSGGDDQSPAFDESSAKHGTTHLSTSTAEGGRSNKRPRLPEGIKMPRSRKMPSWFDCPLLSPEQVREAQQKAHVDKKAIDTSVDGAGKFIARSGDCEQHELLSDQ